MSPKKFHNKWQIILRQLRKSQSETLSRARAKKKNIYIYDYGS